MKRSDKIVAFFSGASWRTWLGHSARWIGGELFGLLLGALLTLVLASWLHPFLLSAGALAGWLDGGRLYGIREFGSEGDFWRAWNAEPRDYDGAGDSFMDFAVPFVLATGVLMGLGYWPIGIL